MHDDVKNVKCLYSLVVYGSWHVQKITNFIEKTVCS